MADCILFFATAMVIKGQNELGITVFYGGVMIEEILEKLKEKLCRAGYEDFARQVEKSYTKVKKDAENNKNKHFKIQNIILYGSAGVSITNVLVTLCNTLGCLNEIVPIITAVSSVISILVTTMIAVKGAKKHSETWLRHQMHQADMEFEMLEYVLSRGKYQADDKENAIIFMDNMLSIWRKNQEKFEQNMANFDRA